MPDLPPKATPLNPIRKPPRTKQQRGYTAEYDRNRKKVMKGLCAVCGVRFAQECHHVKPLADGGSNEVENLTPLCTDCHRKQHDHYEL